MTNLFTLFLDVTANDGWNITAWFTWLLIFVCIAGTLFDFMIKDK